MLKKLIWNDVRQNKMLSAATVFFMTIAAALLILTALLFTELLGTIDGLLEKAMVPDLMQMHAGEVDEGALARFAKSRPEVREWQLCRFSAGRSDERYDASSKRFLVNPAASSSGRAFAGV